MISRNLILCLLGSTAIIVGTIPGAMAGSPYVVGDVFASVGNSTVDVFTPTGTLVTTLNDSSGATFTTGSAFDASGNFYVTNFGSGTISRFDNSGNLVNSSFMSSNNTPESIVVAGTGPFAGSSFVGGPGSAVINQFNTSTGALVHSFSVVGGNDTGGTDWTELQSASSSNILYNGEGTRILSFNLATSTQNADFTSATTEAALTHIFAFRVIPSGAFAGDVLVANSINAVMLDASGNIIRTYTLPGDLGTDFSLNLDPNGTDFWTGDAQSGLMWEVNIATGAIDQQWNTGFGGGSNFFGVSVFGEETVVSQTPLPAALPLFATGLGAMGLFGWRRKRRGQAVA